MRYTNDFDSDSVDIYSSYQDISSSSKGRKKHNRKKKKMKTGKKVAIAILSTLCVILAVLIAGVFWLDRYAYKLIDENIVQEPLETTDPEALNITTDHFSKVKNIALLGIDSRNNNDVGRSDAIIILTIDKERNKIKMTSIARDSYVDIDGHGYDKLTHAYAYGKQDLAVKTLNKNYGVEITDYVKVNFFGFANIIDYIGGVEIDVDAKEREHLNSYVIPKLRKQTSIKCNDIPRTGKQKLSGAQALCYARIRKIDTDIARGNRQKEVLKAMFNKCKRTELSKMPEAAKMILQQCTTSLNSEYILELGKWALLSQPEIEEYSIPKADGKNYNKRINGIYYCVYDLEEASREIRKFILEE